MASRNHIEAKGVFTYFWGRLLIGMDGNVFGIFHGEKKNFAGMLMSDAKEVIGWLDRNQLFALVQAHVRYVFL